jgi:hypothetical protein
MDGSGAFVGGSIDVEEVVERKRGEIRQKGWDTRRSKI